ncbi:MAG: 3-dehydroquinate synthase [Oscillospiraceae bacterium]|jgi:3-dehydroquinate synthase|nr:3-dehydroquinate synthase [Oscillospiraceae bacterium]
MTSIPIEASVPYDVKIASGLLEGAGEAMCEVIAPCRIAIITDSTVNGLYGAQAERSLRDAGYATVRYAFPAGEQNKTLDTLSDILECLAENQMTRSDAIVALGGGVVGDVAGFAAAVYARGIRYVQIPTTLLAAVDSSVGGKTAVDLRAGKNLAGSFHQPSLVLTDTDILEALPEPLLSDGAAEVIKYGVLRDPELLDWLCAGEVRSRMPEIITRSVQIKRDFVLADEFDTGLRQQLNLGHTFGHAIEKCSAFTVTHGQGVAIGMALAAGAANRADVCRAILAANRACGLPTACPYSATELAQAALTDKKRLGDRITLVLPERVGLCKLESIPIHALEDAFARGLHMLEALA